MRINILINTKDRPTELALLLQSLRNQTYQKFDIFILDDFGGIPLTNYHFLNCVIHRMKLEGHNILMRKTPFQYGVSKARQEIVDWSMKDNNNPLLMRVDDDVILESDYIQKLIETLDAGYDLASGITTPALAIPSEREIRFVKPIINEVGLDSEGNILYNGDDCGAIYDKDEIIITPHFRSCALYKRAIHEAGVDYKSNLSKYGFREEEIFSFKCIIAGFKLGVRTGAINYHLLTPSGGERCKNAGEMTNLNEEIFLKWTKKQFKKHGDFIANYYKKHNVIPQGKSNTSIVLGGTK